MSGCIDTPREAAKRAVKRVYLSVRRVLLRAAGRLLPVAAERPHAFPSDGRVLFLRFDRIGDMVLSTPALQAIKRRFPRSPLTVLAAPANRRVLDNDPAVDEVIVFDARFLSHPLRFLGQVNRLRRRRFDLTIDPTIGLDLKSAAVALASGAPLRVGFGGAGREVCFSRPAPPPENDRHFVDATLDLLETVGIRAVDRIPRLRLPVGAAEWARAWLAEHTRPGLAVIAVHPGAHYPSQRWPESHYAGLIDAVRRELPGQSVLIGGPGDREVVREIAARAEGAVPIHVGDDLGRSLALIARCDVLVCNNSGPLHAAAALGVPTVSFMGPTRAARWWPRGERHRVLREEGLPCLGCEAGRCPRGDHACLKRIPPAAALAGIRALLSRPESPSGTTRPERLTA